MPLPPLTLPTLLLTVTTGARSPVPAVRRLGAAPTRAAAAVGRAAAAHRATGGAAAAATAAVGPAGPARHRAAPGVDSQRPDRARLATGCSGEVGAGAVEAWVVRCLLLILCLPFVCCLLVMHVIRCLQTISKPMMTMSYGIVVRRFTCCSKWAQSDRVVVAPYSPNKQTNKHVVVSLVVFRFTPSCH